MMKETVCRLTWQSYINLGDLKKPMEFLKLYLPKVSNNDLDIIVSLISYLVFEIQDPLEYEQFVNNEIPDQFKEYLPLKWNSIINQLNDKFKLNKNKLIIIKDVQTIDWSIEWFKKLKDSSIQFQIIKRYTESLLNYDNMELLLYASNQFLLFTNEYEKLVYRSSFFKAIVEFDFQTIKFIHSLGVTFNQDIPRIHYQDILSSTILGGNGNGGNINYQEVNQIINYLLQHEMISNGSFFSFIDFMAENGYYNDSKLNNDVENLPIRIIDLEKVKIHSNLITQRDIIKELLNCTNYNRFRFLMTITKFTNQDFDLPRIITNSIFPFKDISKPISLIEFVICQLKQSREIIHLSSFNNNNNNDGQSTPTQQELPNLQVYYSILSSLFNSICKSELKLEEFNQIYKILIDNQVELVWGNHIKSRYIKCRYPRLGQYCNYLPY